ncbi:MAG: hypothetical protein IT235_08665 [Bacteroidia bacterium]|nr:hypothetical protein [Bacteroidia bacterium]
MTKKYPELTPYQFASNSPIEGIDLDGLEKVTYLYKTNQETGKPQLTNFRVEKIDAQGNLLPFSRHAELDSNQAAKDLKVPVYPVDKESVYKVDPSGNMPDASCKDECAPILQDALETSGGKP